VDCNAAHEPPRPLPPGKKEFTEEPEAPAGWTEALEAKCPHWNEISLKPNIKRSLNRLFESNQPTDLSQDTWKLVAKANYPLLYLGRLVDENGLFVENVRKSKPIREFPKPKQQPNNKPPQAKAIQEPEHSVDPVISSEERQALFTQMFEKIKGTDDAESKKSPKRESYQGSDELAKRRNGGFGLRPAL
jgi:hypothetical protein